MAFVLIPDGFVLKKVTKAQQDAVDEYFGRERRGSYLNTLIDNPTTATLAVSALTGGVLLSLINKLFEDGSYSKEEIIERLNPAAVFKAAVEERSITRDFESVFALLDEALKEKAAQQ